MLRSCSSLKSIATKPSIKPSSSAPALQSLPSNSHHHSSSPTSSPDPDTTDSHSSLNLTDEYGLVVQTNSYTEIHNKLIVHHHHHPNTNTTATTTNEVASPPLRPSRHSVDDALRRAPPTKLTRLVSTYFDHSETTSDLLCSILHHSLHSARALYSPIHALLSVLDDGAADADLRLSPPQCDALLDLFRHFLSVPNPFPCPTDTTLLLDTRRSFSDLRLQLHRRLRRAQSLSRFPGSAALCVLSAFRRPAHLMLPSRVVERQLKHIAQLDAAAVGAYAVNIELDTINCLVEKLYDTVESDRFLMKFGVERGGRDNRYPIQEVVKQLRKNRASLEKQMGDLEDHVCICLASVNRARLKLLEEIHHHQT